jgi:hypothetical protein
MNLISLSHRRIRHIRDMSDYTHMSSRQYFQMNAEIMQKLLCHRVAVKSKRSSILSSNETSDVQDRI